MTKTKESRVKANKQRMQCKSKEESDAKQKKL